MKKKLAIFDLDGTLIDAYVPIKNTLNFTLAELGYPPISLDTAKKSVGGGDREFALKMVESRDAERFLEIYRDNYMRFSADGLKLMEGGIDILTFLRKGGLRIAAATNRSKYAVSPMLDILKIEGYFDILYTADDVSQPKPSPEMLLKIIEEIGVEKEDSFFVGDMDIDLLTGRNAGVETYIVTTGSTPEEDFSKYDDVQIFPGLREVLCRISQHK